MRINNKPTRGTPLTEEERLKSESMRRGTSPWMGGVRFQMMPSYGSGAKHSGPHGKRGNRYRLGNGQTEIVKRRK